MRCAPSSTRITARRSATTRFNIGSINEALPIGGWRALRRGIPVATTGAPFYAGWGLTEDFASVSRERRATLDELFAAAYLLHRRWRLRRSRRASSARCSFTCRRHSSFTPSRIRRVPCVTRVAPSPAKRGGVFGARHAARGV
ncbi:MAG TPA: hypothetical protein VIG55_01360 [Methylosinus sp.]